MKIYHNPRCTKSRQALNLLQEKGIEPEVIKYLDTPLSFDELAGMLKKLKIKPIDLIRKNEKVYKESFKKKELTDEQWIQAMIDYPKLMERPIIIKGNKAVIGRPTEKVLELL